MASLQPLPTTETLASNISLYQNEQASVLTLGGENIDFAPLRTFEAEHVVVLIPQDWLTQRARKDLDWTVPNPKTKQEVTLYSTTYFYHAVDDTCTQLLDLAFEKEWVIYAVGEEKVCLLVQETKIAVDVDPEKLYAQLKG